MTIDRRLAAAETRTVALTDENPVDKLVRKLGRRCRESLAADGVEVWPATEDLQWLDWCVDHEFTELPDAIMAELDALLEEIAAQQTAEAK